MRSSNTFDSVAPRTYSIICISSESCLKLIVGIARLPCFGTLRSAISAKVALGEQLRLCPGSAGLSTSVEKAKTNCHDKERDWSLFKRFRVPKDLCRLERGVGFVRLKGMYSAPNSAFQILGASPKFKIIEFYGLVRVITHYGLITLFVVPSTSLEGPKNGNKSAQVYPEHPSTRSMGAEAED